MPAMIRFASCRMDRGSDGFGLDAGEVGHDQVRVVPG